VEEVFPVLHVILYRMLITWDRRPCSEAGGTGLGKTATFSTICDQLD
jgi:hypothetical protein